LTDRSEDLLLLNALTPKITNMKKIYAALESFLEKKKNNDPTDRFNIILFQESGPNYLNDFTLNLENIMLALKTLEPTIVEANISYGIFVATTFIIDVFKRISNKTFRLIILKDPETIKIPLQYLPVLENLIEKVKDMPFYIDLVRIGIKNSEKDENLKKLIEITNGSIYKIDKIAELNSMGEIVDLKHKMPKVSYHYKPKIIPDNNKPFYINLAEEPSEFRRVEKCSICFQRDDEGLMQCPKCKTIVHKSCLAKWSQSSNIGIENVFRCHNCYNLLKLDKEYIELVKYGEIVSAGDIKVEEKDFQEFLENLEEKEKPKIIKANDSLAPPKEKKEAEKKKKDKESVRFILCPKCHKMITNQYKKCPSCGAKL
jgi:hypothetical protein